MLLRRRRHKIDDKNLASVADFNSICRQFRTSSVFLCGHPVQHSQKNITLRWKWLHFEPTLENTERCTAQTRHTTAEHMRKKSRLITIGCIAVWSSFTRENAQEAKKLGKAPKRDRSACITKVNLTKFWCVCVCCVLLWQRGDVCTA